MNATATVEITRIEHVSGETVYAFRDECGAWVTAVFAGYSANLDVAIRDADVWIDQHQVPADYDECRRAAEDLNDLAIEVAYARAFNDTERLDRAVSQLVA